MANICFDQTLTDDARRKRLYAGDLFLLQPTASSLALCDLARILLREAFGPLDPETAQFEMPVDAYARLLAGLKPQFIHHPESKRLIRTLLQEVGCGVDKTYFDVPRMRSSTSDNYLTAGIAYAFHPHRDTWYSAPMCQINWWMPIFPIEPRNAMAFHPGYFSNGVPNTSKHYDYQRWAETSRFSAAQHIGSDTREQPKSLVEIAVDPDVRLLPPVGGMILFSGAQLHSSVPNDSGRTRFSIDFRTIDIDDARECVGADNVDSHSTGTAMGDYLRASDLAPVPQEIIDAYMPGHPQPARMRAAE